MSSIIIKTFNPIKMAIKTIVLLFFSLATSIIVSAQDDLESLLLNEIDETIDYTMGTFLSTYLLNSQSTEFINKDGVGIRISHKFGIISSNGNNFFGFDDTNSLMEINYSLADWWNIGLGRATLNESINGFTKFRFLRQSTGASVIPVTAALLLSANYTTIDFDDLERNKNRSDRLDYTSQLLLARKFNHKLSTQLIPTYIHRNLVETKNDLNDIFALGFGATYKLTNRFHINMEYYKVQKHNTSTQQFYDPMSFGICYQTSRHTFELFATNATGITENRYIALTTNDFWEGDIRIGFNVSIIFSLNR